MLIRDFSTPQTPLGMTPHQLLVSCVIPKLFLGIPASAEPHFAATKGSGVTRTLTASAGAVALSGRALIPDRRPAMRPRLRLFQLRGELQ